MKRSNDWFFTPPPRRLAEQLLVLRFRRPEKYTRTSSNPSSTDNKHNNRYSVNASAVGRPVEIHAYTDRLVVCQDGRLVGEHPRKFGRGQTEYDAWRYVPVLARKPGALRNGAPFKDWVLPAALDKIRRKFSGSDEGDRQMVKVLAAVLTDVLPAVEAACAQPLAEGVHSADVILNILARRRERLAPAPIATPASLALRTRRPPTAPATTASSSTSYGSV